MSLNPMAYKNKAYGLNNETKEAKLPNLHIEKEPIEIVDSHRVFGVVINNNLTWHDQVNFLSKNLSRKVHQFCRIKHSLNVHVRTVFLHAHMISVISR